jgi:hypothetical protein
MLSLDYCNSFEIYVMFTLLNGTINFKEIGRGFDLKTVNSLNRKKYFNVQSTALQTIQNCQTSQVDFQP